MGPTPSQPVKTSGAGAILCMRTGRPPKPLLQRLEEKSEPQPNGCIYWKGGVFETGYGAICLPGGKTVTVHRVAYELKVGPIPKGKALHHTCHCRLCIAPAHLVPVDSKQHAQAHTAERTHCKKGHPYYPNNFYVVPGKSGPTKTCKICQKTREKAQRIAFRASHPAKPHANSAKSHCKRGHPFTPENTRITTQGGRQCKKCFKMLSERWKAAHPTTPRGTPKAFCKHGHEMTQANTYIYRGRRSCRVCILDRIHKSRANRRTSINTIGLGQATSPARGDDSGTAKPAKQALQEPA